MIHTRTGVVACVQPEREPLYVQLLKLLNEMGVELGSKVGYSVAFESCCTKNH